MGTRSRTRAVSSLKITISGARLKTRSSSSSGSAVTTSTFGRSWRKTWAMLSRYARGSFASRTSTPRVRFSTAEALNTAARLPASPHLAPAASPRRGLTYLDDAVARREDEGLQPRVHPELVEDVHHVGALGLDGDAQPLGDLAALQPFGQGLDRKS